uniref:Uncharacterized protein LOC114324759 n=1 Tax=Diabrotica virgifera virgifera TaxID=50390 RepID=A0A6P7F0J9_DIAVI
MSCRSKLLVDLALKKKQKSLEIKDCSQPSPLLVTTPTLKMVPYSTPAVLSQDYCSHDNPNTSQRMEYELVPCGEENEFILKPVSKPTEDILNRSSEQSTILELSNSLPEWDKITPSLGAIVEDIINLNDEDNLRGETILEEIAAEENSTHETIEYYFENSETCIPNETLIEMSEDPEQGRIQEITENYTTDAQPGQDLNKNGCEIVNSRDVLGKRKRNKKPYKQIWKTEQSKEKRMKGEEYSGRGKNEAGQIMYDIKRPKREMKSRCLCKPKNKSVFQCHRITEKIRKTIFIDYWLLNWEERRILIRQLVDNRNVSRRKVESENVRRKGSLYYHLKVDQSQQRIRVCKKMFLNTLCMGEWAVLNWVTTQSVRMGELQVEEEGSGDDEEGRENGDDGENIAHLRSHVNREKKKDADTSRKTILKEFFNNLPKLESHYCRKTTKKLYLEQNWQSKAHLYREYKSYCESVGKSNYIASDCLFYTVFDELNLALFSPKKDQCDLCCSFTKGNLSQEEYSTHLEKKN